MRYSTAYFLYVHQHAVANRETHDLMTTAVLRSVAAGSLNVGRHVLRQTPVHGSFSDEPITNWVTEKREAFRQHLVTQQSSKM